MSKQKPKDEIEIESLDIEALTGYSDQQFEDSSDAAYNFVTDLMLPALLDFDFNNSDDDYIPGSAAFVMFIKISQLLMESGWSIDELQREIEEHVHLADFDGTVH